jgi:release factor glutamine methyltransferase
LTVCTIEQTGSIATARRTLAQAFRAAGLDSPEIDARVLLGHALGFDQSALASHAARELTPRETEAIAALMARRLAHEPVARIVGSKEFWSLELTVTSATLVPRPETETVVEAALTAVDASGPRARALRLVDLGTGSGALLIALLSELPQAIGVGTDKSPAALAVARANAARHGLAGRARFLACDFSAALTGRFDVVVANPPYVGRGTISTLAPEVRNYDPMLALDGGADGLAAYRAIAADAGRLLAPTGVLAVEIGDGQCETVAGLLSAAGLVITGMVNDLAGVPRALTAGKMP